MAANVTGSVRAVLKSLYGLMAYSVGSPLCRTGMGIFFTWHSSEHIYHLDVNCRGWKRGLAIYLQVTLRDRPSGGS